MTLKSWSESKLEIQFNFTNNFAISSGPINDVMNVQIKQRAYRFFKPKYCNPCSDVNYLKDTVVCEKRARANNYNLNEIIPIEI